jgi:hypothetical protein
MLIYFEGVLKRMDKQCFPPNDPLRKSVAASQQALLHLKHQLQVLTCHQRGGRAAWRLGEELSQERRRKYN